MNPQLTRLQLVAPIGSDAMGTHWRAVDVAHGREVRAHELTGAYAQWRPELPPGHELVVDGGRAFVVAPPVGVPETTPRRTPRTGMVVGVVVAVVVAVIIVVGGVVVLVRGLADLGGDLAQPASVTPGPGAVNAGLLAVKPGDCVYAIGRAADPTNDLGAEIRPCRVGEGYHRVLSIHNGVARSEVADIAASRWDYCDVPADTVFWLIWVSPDGEAGMLVCASRRA